MGKFPIETERLIIRPLKMADVQEYYSITRDKSVEKYVPYAYPKSFEDARQDFKEFYTKGDLEHDFYLALEDKKKNRLVGAMIVTQNYKKEFDMSLIIGTEYRGKKYMKECLQAFVKVMRKESVLLFIIDRKNTSSYNLVKKLPNIQDVTMKYEKISSSNFVYQLVI